MGSNHYRINSFKSTFRENFWERFQIEDEIDVLWKKVESGELIENEEFKDKITALQELLEENDRQFKIEMEEQYNLK